MHGVHFDVSDDAIEFLAAANAMIVSFMPEGPAGTFQQTG
jgi:hypothetical protein